MSDIFSGSLVDAEAELVAGGQLVVSHDVLTLQEILSLQYRYITNILTAQTLILFTLIDDINIFAESLHSGTSYACSGKVRKSTICMTRMSNVVNSKKTGNQADNTLATLLLLHSIVKNILQLKKLSSQICYFGIEILRLTMGH